MSFQGFLGLLRAKVTQRAQLKIRPGGQEGPRDPGEPVGKLGHTRDRLARSGVNGPLFSFLGLCAPQEASKRRAGGRQTARGTRRGRGGKGEKMREPRSGVMERLGPSERRAGERASGRTGAGRERGRGRPPGLSALLSAAAD